jgi:hypothetical protein
MLTTEKTISAFEKLGEYLRKPGLNVPDDLKFSEGQGKNHFDRLIEESHIYNPWFIPEFVREACLRLGESLTLSKLNQWLSPYRNKLSVSGKVRNVGVVMAGNIPLAGFHDFISVLMSGNRFIGKLSSDDNKLLPFIARKLVEIEPGFEAYIEMTEGKLENFNAVIATGSNNSSRYFEYYFGKHPHIIRKNRNGVAVLTGHESIEDLKNLGRDIFLYFGLGCRNVSKVFVPAGYSFNKLLETAESYNYVGNHNKYRNNYEYYKSIFLINGVHHLDNGFLLVAQDNSYSSPPAVLYFEEYNDPSDLVKKLSADSQKIQCIVSGSKDIPVAIPFGTAQNPELWDYADGIDTMEFLINLKSLIP